MAPAEQIYAIVKTLPPAQASEILTFAEFVCAKHLKARQDVDRADAAIPWTTLVHALSGAWAQDDFPTLEKIRAESGTDILRECL